MGVIFSRHKPARIDYEEILAELDAKIQKAELTLSEIKVRERRWNVLWILYSAVMWMVYTLYSFLALQRHAVNFENLLLYGGPVVVTPLIIYYIRKALQWVFTRTRRNQEQYLAKLRNEQRLIVEELKNKTAYYTTKSLLDRYGVQTQALNNNNGNDMMPPRVPPPKRPFTPQVPQLAVSMPQHHTISRDHQWYDWLYDAVVGGGGDDRPESNYALICQHCFSHNGLIPQDQFNTIQYICPKCKKFNSSRQSHPQNRPASQSALQLISPAFSPDQLKEDEDVAKYETIGARVRERHRKRRTQKENIESQ